MTDNFKSKILRQRTTPEEYKVYKAALEWDLTDPIVIESAEDFKSKRLWQEKLTPFHHQVTNLITFCRRLPVTLLADDVGLGKTISAGLIISELIARSRLSKILIVCPKLLGPQWKSELNDKFGISAEVVIGKDLVTADPEDVGAIITTYNSARLYLDKIPEDRFQMLILDEAHKLRNLYGTDKTPEVAKCFRKALQDRRFRFVLMLTATPIQNRLWDLYSLVDLLTVARGHENPFGDAGIFARKFIADNREDARQLKLEARDEFRSIVYGYMSRVRRGDANLLFPDRVVQMHKVDPTQAELELIRTIAEPIKQLNRLAQISILQALTSSPDALLAQLLNMAQRGTVPQELAFAVKAIVTRMPQNAKLNGLEQLIQTLKKQNPEGWRLVVFTGRRETQTTIKAFLEGHGLKVGVINGDSGDRNQETIAQFKKNPPDIRVIVSTEAGSEGVNLQVANVLVNYDLPWNPMMVEQRIGRVQRLGSEYAHVSIFNIMLRGTFEEYIVGRLMEKLQMASHAIGDIEALLQGSEISDGDDDPADSFQENILNLVLSALAGKDVERELCLKEVSIENAKKALKQEEDNINALLGGMDGAGYVGPRTPTLPSMIRSMDPRDFTIAGLQNLGVRLTPHSPILYAAEENGGREYIRFEDPAPEDRKSTLYRPGSSAFQRLISRLISTGIHEVEDEERNTKANSEEIAKEWASTFDGKLNSVDSLGARRYFDGSALLRVRATVAHDSYERLVNVSCHPEDHHTKNSNRSFLSPIGKVLDDPVSIGIDTERLIEAANLDDGIAEFSRFYIERRSQETAAANGDQRKRQKLHDEFTPRIETTLVGLEGKVSRDIKLRVRYNIDPGVEYESDFSISAHQNKITDAPAIAACEKSGKKAPVTCLLKCEISGKRVLKHLLVKSEAADRYALPEFIVSCALSGKKVLQDEVEVSAVTGHQVRSTLLKTSHINGKRAEPEFFGTCSFTNVEALKTELAMSEISNRPYRSDEQARSSVSGKTGHLKEFVECFETRQLIATTEAEQCQITGKQVRPGILVTCELSGKRVLPSEVARCSVTGKTVLKSLLVASSISNVLLLADKTILSSTGQYCSPSEARVCFWSGKEAHPGDLRICSLTGLSIHIQYTAHSPPPRLSPLDNMLSGLLRTRANEEAWPHIETRIVQALKGGKCKVEAAELSPDGKHVAGCSMVKTLLGFRTQHVGFIYSVVNDSIVGRITTRKRD